MCRRSTCTGSFHLCQAATEGVDWEEFEPGGRQQGVEWMSGRPRRGWTGTPWQPPLSVLNEVALRPGSLPSLAQGLAAVTERRHPRGFKADLPPYPLVPILLVVPVGLLCGHRGYAAIAAWAAARARDHSQVWSALGFLPTEQPRTPVPATLFRLVRDVD